MAAGADKNLIYRTIQEYVSVLKDHKIKICRLYLFGSYARGRDDKGSDIDLAVFIDKDDIDGFDDDDLLMKLRRGVDTRIEPHAFSRADLHEPDPYIKEIIDTGERII